MEAKADKRWRLFWATTEDHSEDWFIVAHDAESARRAHEEMEGFETEEAQVEFVLAIPDHVEAEEGWPTDELLEKLGAMYVPSWSGRAVLLDGRIFKEGSVADDAISGMLRREGESEMHAHISAWLAQRILLDGSAVQTTVPLYNGVADLVTDHHVIEVRNALNAESITEASARAIDYARSIGVSVHRDPRLDGEERQTLLVGLHRSPARS